MIKTEENYVLTSDEMRACAYALRTRIKVLHAQNGTTADGEIGELIERATGFCRELLGEYNRLEGLDGTPRVI